MSMVADVRTEGERVVKGRHSEYDEFHISWRWLQDSLEGGQRYRDADYGYQNYTVTYQVQDTETGQPIDRYRNASLPRRNLIRHPQEYPVGPGQRGTGEQYGEGGASTGDEYEFRRALTPVPDFVQESIGTHLARIYTRKVRRVPPPGPLGEALAAWWEDVDGAGTTIDDWMQETIAPLFLVLGQLDLAFDRPPAPDGEDVGSAADEARMGLDRCVASYILPENLLDWELEPDRTYCWVNVREWDGDTPRYRHWTEEGWTLYDAKGQYIDDGKHPYGCVPIRRGFDVRKARCNNVGQSNYEQIAEIQRTYYNVDSELTLMNSLAAHPMLSGPEDLIRGLTIAVGPGHVLPMVRNPSGQYQGWTYVSAPSDASDRLRAKLNDLRDAADRAAALTKPAGAKGTTGHTVSQSGVSKMMDAAVGNDLLTRRARSLERLETMAACKALEVLNGGPVDPEVLKQVVVAYPTKFDLYTAADFAALIGEFQALLGGLEGQLPVVSGHLYSTYERMMLSGLDDQDYRDMDAEMVDYIAQKQERAAQLGEAATQFPFPQIPPGGPTTD